MAGLGVTRPVPWFGGPQSTLEAAEPVGDGPAAEHPLAIRTAKVAKHIRRLLPGTSFPLIVSKLLPGPSPVNTHWCLAHQDGRLASYLASDGALLAQVPDGLGVG